MKNKLAFLTLILSLLTTAAAFGNCKVAVGGPGANQDALSRLSGSLNDMFETHADLKIGAFPVSSLSDAMYADADYMVYLTGYSSSVRVQFRNLLVNKIMMEETYASAAGLDAVIQHIASDLEQKVIPLLSNRCK